MGHDAGRRLRVMLRPAAEHARRAGGRWQR
jgi:hypothetical protein